MPASNIGLQDEVKQLRREMQELKSFYASEMQDMRTALRKQKGEWVRQLNDALGKVEQQSKLIATQQKELDKLKKSAQIKQQQSSASKLTASASKLTLTTKDNDADEESEHSVELLGLCNPHLNNSNSKFNQHNKKSPSTFYEKATESFMHDSFRPMEDDLLDEGDGNVEVEFDFDIPPEIDVNEEVVPPNGNNRNTLNRDETSNLADDHRPMRRSFARRASLDSVQTIDLEEPRKKTVSLLPHKSVQIYNEQRADSVLRKIMKSKVKEKGKNISVKKVHGKNLVFFYDRIYLPEGLRHKTMEYYHEKYGKKGTPILHLEKHFYWPDMDLDMRKFENKANRMNWKVRLETDSGSETLSVD